MRLLPMLLETSSFKEFEEKVGKSNIENFDVNLKIQNDKGCQVASEIYLDLLNNKEFDNVDSTSSFKEYLSLLSTTTKDFSCRSPHNTNSKFTGAAWLTGSMRDNLNDLGVTCA